MTRKSVFRDSRVGSLSYRRTALVTVVWIACLFWSPDLVFSNTVEANDELNVQNTETIEDRNSLVSEEKKSSKEETGLPEDARFLAGPSLNDHLLFSNHSCSCHAPLSPFSEANSGTRNLIKLSHC